MLNIYFIDKLTEFPGVLDMLRESEESNVSL